MVYRLRICYGIDLKPSLRLGPVRRNGHFIRLCSWHSLPCIVIVELVGPEAAKMFLATGLVDLLRH